MEIKHYLHKNIYKNKFDFFTANLPPGEMRSDPGLFFGEIPDPDLLLGEIPVPGLLFGEIRDPFGDVFIGIPALYSYNYEINNNSR